ncbi:hypothetical protein E1091_05735 [Micromonospora fluostatini]|uniref:Uncharacterized protein n=1 Tax=Micromonospora fluostatini TaxID=1629071 RepID=A0ABY2DJ68_9ACTN|nr:hypothetical protein E1091_05735 [Micromonospora fluostatini]
MLIDTGDGVISYELDGAEALVDAEVSHETFDDGLDDHWLRSRSPIRSAAPRRGSITVNAASRRSGHLWVMRLRAGWPDLGAGRPGDSEPAAEHRCAAELRRPDVDVLRCERWRGHTTDPDSAEHVCGLVGWLDSPLARPTPTL